MSGLITERILTVEQVAELFQVEPGWVRARARSGHIPARKLGKYWRFDRDEVLEWWEGGCTPSE